MHVQRAFGLAECMVRASRRQHFADIVNSPSINHVRRSEHPLRPPDDGDLRRGAELGREDCRRSQNDRGHVHERVEGTASLGSQADHAGQGDARRSEEQVEPGNRAQAAMAVGATPTVAKIMPARDHGKRSRNLKVGVDYTAQAKRHQAARIHAQLVR